MREPPYLNGCLDFIRSAMQQRGPHELTLADIAAKAGVTPGLLVQRFGSKRELLLALSERFAACMSDLASTPDALSRNLAYLQIDLTDEAFRANLLTNARATRKEIESLLQSAVVAGELQKNVDAPRLARTIEAIIGGSLMSWACYREGSAAAWIRQDVDAVLRPHLAPRRRSTR